MGLARCVAAAATVAGTNIMDQSHAVDPRNRVLKRVGVVGSTAIGDCGVDIHCGDKILATCYNSVAGAAKEPLDSDFKNVEGFVAKNIPLTVVLKAAPNANQLVVMLEFEPYVRKGGAYTRTAGAVSGKGYDFNAWKQKKIAAGQWRGTV